MKGSKLWDRINKKKVLSTDVIFDKKTTLLNKVKTNEEKKTDVVEEATEFLITKWVMESSSGRTRASGA